MTTTKSPQLKARSHPSAPPTDADTPIADTTELLIVGTLLRAVYAVQRARALVLTEITEVPTATSQVRMLTELDRLTSQVAALATALTNTCTIRLDGRPRA